MRRPREPYCFPNLLETLFVLVALYFTEMLVNVFIWHLGRSAGLRPMAVYSIGRVLASGLVFTVLLHHSGGTYRDLLHESRSSWRATLGLFTIPVLLLTPGLLVTNNLAEMLVVRFFPLSTSLRDGTVWFIDGGLGSIMLICVIAPVVEEMLFRGIILRSFLKQYAPDTAIVRSAAVFGLAHLNVYQFVVAFVIGLVVGKLYQRTRSLLPGMLVHGFYNTSVVISALAWSDDAEGDGIIGWPVAWQLAALVCGVVGAWLLYRLVRPVARPVREA